VARIHAGVLVDVRGSHRRAGSIKAGLFTDWLPALQKVAPKSAQRSKTASACSVGRRLWIKLEGGRVDADDLSGPLALFKLRSWFLSEIMEEPHYLTMFAFGGEPSENWGCAGGVAARTPPISESPNACGRFTASTTRLCGFLSSAGCA